MNERIVDNESQRRAAELLTEFLRRRDAGENMDADSLLEAHPESSGPLSAYFEVERQLTASGEGHLATLVAHRDASSETAEIGRGRRAPPIPAAPDSAAPALRSFGDYELLEMIARGGMGVVYKARQKKLNRVVAIKMILAGQFADAHEIDRFYAEAEAAAGLRHPHIVGIHEIGECDGQHFFSMDFIEGKSLADMTRESPLEARQAADFVRCISQTMQYAHDHNILHRDLKPSNVLVDHSNQPLITDFGLAKQVTGQSQLTVTGAIVGTPSYMPPEQASGKSELVGPGSDIYSMGAIFYELLTGRPPFRAATPFETIRQVLDVEPVSPRLINPSVPHDAETICLKCLHKEPSKRYATAAELAEELNRFLRGEPILARPVGRLERSWRWCRRNPRLATASGAAVLGVAIALIATTVGYFTTSAALRESRESQKDSELSFLDAFAAVNDLFTRVSEESLLKQPGMQPLRRDLLERALQYYHRLLARRRDNPELQDELGTTYYRVGVITEALESASKALTWYEQAEALQRRLLNEAPEMPQRLEAMGATLNALGTAWFRLHDLDKALSYYRQAIRIRSKLFELDRNNIESVRLLANTHMNLGLLEGDSGNVTASHDEFAKAQQLRREMLERHDDWKLRRDLAKGEYNLGYMELSASNLTTAEQHFADAVVQFERVVDEDPNDMDTQVLLSTSYRLLGDLGQYHDPPVDPQPWYSKALQRLRRLVDQNPAVVDYQLEYAGVLLNKGEWERGEIDPTAALKTFDEAQLVLSPLVERFPKMPRYRRDLAVALTALGQQHVAAGNKDEARASLQRSIDHLQVLLKDDQDNEEWQQRLALAQDSLAAVDTADPPN